jgi:hypothetical protein
VEVKIVTTDGCAVRTMLGIFPNVSAAELVLMVVVAVDWGAESLVHPLTTIAATRNGSANHEYVRFPVTRPMFLARAWPTHPAGA